MILLFKNENDDFIILEHDDSSTERKLFVSLLKDFSTKFRSFDNEEQKQKFSESLVSGMMKTLSNNIRFCLMEKKDRVVELNTTQASNATFCILQKGDINTMPLHSIFPTIDNAE